MPNYIVNRVAQPGSGDHEVHDKSTTKGCLPASFNQLDLGWFSTCKEAVTAANRHYSDVNGCYYCANDCHTT